MNPTTDHWINHAQQWKQLSSPLRPHSEDIAVFQKIVNEVAALRNHTLNVILLGVTPELAQLDWPEATSLFAIERSPQVARTLWLQAHKHQLILGNWLDMPFADDCIDLILGDGCYTTLESPANYRSLNQELYRLLAPKGFFAHRFFTQPPTQQTLGDVLQLDEKNFHAFKWRLAMALQQNFSEGVAVDDIWQTFTKNNCSNAHWAQDDRVTIDSYRKSTSRYTFPSKSELHKHMSEFFSQVAITHNSYTLAECCPIILYQKSQNV